MVEITIGVKLRSAVRTFAEQMELVLRQHDSHKGKRGWKKARDSYLMSLLVKEFGKLVVSEADDDHAKMRANALDLANLCMMVYDNTPKE